MFYRAIVEDNNHPDKNGKVKVRVFGVHSKNNQNSGLFDSVSTDDLPWAEVIGSNEFGLVSGVGLSSILKQGTWVWVFFSEGDVNYPVIFGTIKGIPTESSVGKSASGLGFYDPDGYFPTRLNVPDINEIARGVIQDTVIHAKNTNLDSSIVYSESAQSTSTYPLNNVLETQSGHMLEFDDTTGAERIQLIDKQGNYIEMKIGEMVEKAINDRINIVVGNLLEHINRNIRQKVDGAITITADGNVQFNNSVKIVGDLEATGDVADSQGNLDSLRSAYDAHYHIGNLGVATAVPTTTDPKVKTTVTVSEN